MIDEQRLDQIYNHISELSQQNETLKNQLNQYRQSILQVCKCSGFSSWYNFTQWVFRYFKEIPPLAQIGKTKIEEQTNKSINRLFNQNQNLPLIEQEQYQSTISQRSLHDTLKNITNKFHCNEQQDWRNQTLHLDKIKRDVSTVQFSQIQHIVLQNVQLRQQNNVLKKQVQSTKQSLYILANLLQMQRKQISPKCSNRTKIILKQEYEQE